MYRRVIWPHGSMMALFLILYGVVRIVAELFREPDPYLGFVVQGITMGQLLSIIMIAAGLLLWRLRMGKS
jgi:phosphatidylglycerol---prolipoprotein diacylglyceryl transferase